MLVAIQPEAPGCQTLEYARKELCVLEEIVPKENLIKLGIQNTPSTVENVLSNISKSSIVHLACHGKQNMTKPLKSFLVLDGGGTLEISQLMADPMSKASLVFLCACETAMGTDTLPDEALHLAASMLFAGFRTAVATTW